MWTSTKSKEKPYRNIRYEHLKFFACSSLLSGPTYPTRWNLQLTKAPKLVEIIAAVPEEQRETLLPRLKVKPVRTASGIAVVAVMSKPHRCPHIATTGNICIYCPGGPDSDFEYSTQSYTGYEPTSMRAIRARCRFPFPSFITACTIHALVQSICQYRV